MSDANEDTAPQSPLPRFWGPNILAAADGLAEAVIGHHAPAFLTRGGPVGRATAAVARGASVDEAVKQASKFGKGHMAELRPAVELTVNAAAIGVPLRAYPNATANHPHADVFISTPGGKQSIQVGVGGEQYLRRKARLAGADSLLVPDESLVERSEWRLPVITQLKAGGARSKVLDGTVVLEDAKDALRRTLEGDSRVGELAKLGVAAYSGLKATRDAFVVSLLFDVAESFAANRKLDGTSLVRNALASGARSGVRTAVQTYVAVDKFLGVAKQAFNAKIAAKVAQGLAWTGAVADVVVSSAFDVWSWVKGEIDFEEVLRRAGAHAATALGGLAGSATMLYAFRDAPVPLQVLGVLVCGYLGATLGRHVGQKMFEPRWLRSSP